jgi:hypothetical protein
LKDIAQCWPGKARDVDHREACMRFLTVSVFAFLACACGGAEVNVRNQSSTRLEGVVISAQGVSAAIDAVEPSAERKTSICPKGEAGSIELSFLANGAQHQSKHSLYFEMQLVLQSPTQCFTRV